MNPELETLEQKLSLAGQGLRYPSTPPVAAAVMDRLNRRTARGLRALRWRWALAAVLALLAALMLIPPARAAILEFIQIGVVRIFRGPGTSPASAPTEGLGPPGTELPLTATPVPQASTASATPVSLLDLAGETTLTQAQDALKFRILLPTYPPDLGLPDHVYLQHPGDSMLVMVWLDPAQSGHIRMSLQEIAPGSWTLSKFNPVVVTEVSVNGQRAAWTEGPYFVESRNGEFVEWGLVAGHALIWQSGDITYRLETGLPVEEAIKIAESLQPAHLSLAPVPAGLEHAEALVQSLAHAGVTVLSVQDSKLSALFSSANQAAWIETSLGIADAVLFLDPTESEHIKVVSLQGQEAGRYLFAVAAPPPTMEQAATIDAAFPLYFEIGNGMFISTDSADLDQVLRRVMGKSLSPGAGSVAPHP